MKAALAKGMATGERTRLAGRERQIRKEEIREQEEKLGRKTQRWAGRERNQAAGERDKTAEERETVPQGEKNVSQVKEPGHRGRINMRITTVGPGSRIRKGRRSCQLWKVLNANIGFVTA